MTVSNRTHQHQRSRRLVASAALAVATLGIASQASAQITATVPEIWGRDCSRITRRCTPNYWQRNTGTSTSKVYVDVWVWRWI
jgi:hypothetical protein